jgi:sulfite reductase (NADPH) hemoprotein beta-component
MTEALSLLEQIKADSNFLRGTLAKGMADQVTGGISENDNKLLKFHGSYQQDDRDLRDERRKQKLEPLHAFMIRARLPGGVITPAQWLAFDSIARELANKSLRITTRQTFQWHGVLKRNLKSAIAAIHNAYATTLGACGDINRQVVSSANPVASSAHALAHEWAGRLSEHFLPRTLAYSELWLDGEKVASAEPEHEPLYGPTYLPRKFKIGLAIPPTNDIDVFAQDLGLIAIIENNELLGFNVAVGGGMGASHGDDTTYARLGSLIGFVLPENLIELAEQVVTVQRDFGNRVEREHARLKYTIDHRGLNWFMQELNSRLSFVLEPVRDYVFDHNGDRFGWIEGAEGRWHLTLYIEAGRLIDREDGRLGLTGLREIAHVHRGHFRLTCNQNLIIADVPADKREQIDALVARYKLDAWLSQSPLALNAIACVALPTCGLAMAESERYLPELLRQLEALLAAHGLQDAPILLRLSGCPNGCSRPYLGEIALVGRAVGRYDLRLGADFTGERLNVLYKENLPAADILANLDTLFAAYAGDRLEHERFGDFLVRTGTIPAPEQNRIPIRWIA